MKKYFNTKEKAETHLEYRRTCAYKRIEEEDDILLADGSFVYKGDQEDEKWMVWMHIITKSFMEEVYKMHNFDFEAALIEFTPQEIALYKEKMRKKTAKKYKTLDIEDYTINK